MHAYGHMNNVVHYALFRYGREWLVDSNATVDPQTSPVSGSW